MNSTPNQNDNDVEPQNQEIIFNVQEPQSKNGNNENPQIHNYDNIENNEQQPLNQQNDHVINYEEQIKQTQKNSDFNPGQEGPYSIANEDDPKYMNSEAIKKIKKKRKQERLMTSRRLKKILQTKPIDKIKLAYQAYFFIVSLIVLTLSILSYRKQSVYAEDYNQFLDNMNSYVIDDIQYTYTNKNCEDQFGSNYTSLYQYQWAGTQIGCDCSSNYNFSLLNDNNVDAFFKSEFMIGRICNQDMIANGCSTVNEQYSKIFNSWNDGSYGRPFVLCAKRNIGVGLTTNITNCNSNTKTICGSGDNIFCVPQNSSCPISNIGFTTDSNYLNLSTLNDSTKGVIYDLGSGFYFYYLRNTSSLPIVEVRVTEYDKVCARNQKQNISPNRVDYPLMNSRRIQCSDTDPEFQEIYSIDEEQFYLSNNVIYLEDKLPYFNINTKYNWTMNYKTYIQWANNCRGEIFDDVLSEGKTLNYVYMALRVELGVTIAYFIVIGVIFNIVGTMTALNFAWSCMTTRPDAQYNYIFIIEIGSKIALQIAEIIVIIVSFAIINDKRVAIKKVIDNNCTTDSVSKSFFSHLENDLTEYAWSYNLAILVIFAVTIIIDILIIKNSITHGSLQGSKKIKEHDHNKLDLMSGPGSAIGPSSNQEENKLRPSSKSND